MFKAARVLDARFLGDVAWSSLPCRARRPILARVRESDAPPQGAEIGVSIDTGAVLVFEAEKRGAGPLTISWSAACDGGAFTAIVP